MTEFHKRQVCVRVDNNQLGGPRHYICIVFQIWTNDVHICLYELQFLIITLKTYVFKQSVGRTSISRIVLRVSCCFVVMSPNLIYTLAVV